MGERALRLLRSAGALVDEVEQVALAATVERGVGDGIEEQRELLGDHVLIRIEE